MRMLSENNRGMFNAIHEARHLLPMVVAIFYIIIAAHAYAKLEWVVAAGYPLLIDNVRVLAGY